MLDRRTRDEVGWRNKINGRLNKDRKLKLGSKPLDILAYLCVLGVSHLVSCITPEIPYVHFGLRVGDALPKEENKRKKKTRYFNQVGN